MVRPSRDAHGRAQVEAVGSREAGTPPPTHWSACMGVQGVPLPPKGGKERAGAAAPAEDACNATIRCWASSQSRSALPFASRSCCTCSCRAALRGAGKGHQDAQPPHPPAPARPSRPAPQHRPAQLHGDSMAPCARGSAGAPLLAADVRWCAAGHPGTAPPPALVLRFGCWPVFSSPTCERSEFLLTSFLAWPFQDTLEKARTRSATEHSVCQVI